MKFSVRKVGSANDIEYRPAPTSPRAVDERAEKGRSFQDLVELSSKTAGTSNYPRELNSGECRPWYRDGTQIRGAQGGSVGGGVGLAVKTLTRLSCAAVRLCPVTCSEATTGAAPGAALLL